VLNQRKIEAVLGDHPKIRDCIVTVHVSSSAGKRLVAYFVGESGHNISPDELRQFLQQKLPEYMVPSFFIPLAKLPLNANGKVNRAALPVQKSIQRSRRHRRPARFNRNATRPALGTCFGSRANWHPQQFFRSWAAFHAGSATGCGRSNEPSEKSCP